MLVNPVYDLDPHPSLLLILILVYGALGIRRLPLRFAAFALLILGSLLQFLHFQYFGTIIQPIEFHLALANSDEILESFAAELPEMMLPLLVIVALSAGIIVLERFCLPRGKARGGFLVIGLLALFLAFPFQYLQAGSEKIANRKMTKIQPMTGLHSSINFLRSLTYYLTGILPLKIKGTNTDFPLVSPPEKDPEPVDIGDIVLVIGESLGTSHMSLFGYGQATTPLLQSAAEQQRVRAGKIYSAGTMTQTALTAMFNHLKYPGQTTQITLQTHCLFKLAKQNGFKTHFYSSQTRRQLGTFLNRICPREIDRLVKRDGMSIDPEELRIEHFEDMKLVEKLAPLLGNSHQDFIVLHMRGSHSPYADRYPKGFGRFPSSYDNSVLFSDRVLDRILRLVEKNDADNSVFLFTSDHGELVGEHGKHGHGWFYPEVYEVPFLFHSRSQDLVAQAEKVRSHYDLGSLLIHLLGYKSHVTPSRDVFVNGSDIDALAGYLHLKLDEEGNVISSEKFRGQYQQQPDYQ